MPKPLFPWKAYQERNPTGPEIIAGLDGLDEDGTIQEIKGEEIYWMTDRGRERITSFKAFFNRLPKIRKQFSPAFPGFPISREIHPPIVGSMSQQLRKYVRYPALVEAGLVNNRVTLGRWIKSGRFPKPVQLGPNIVAWRLEEIEKYLADLEKARETA